MSAITSMSHFKITKLNKSRGNNHPNINIIHIHTYVIDTDRKD